MANLYTYQAVNASGKTQKGTPSRRRAPRKRSPPDQVPGLLPDLGPGGSEGEEGRRQKEEGQEGRRGVRRQDRPAGDGRRRQKEEAAAAISIGGVSAKHLDAFSRASSRPCRTRACRCFGRFRSSNRQQKPGCAQECAPGRDRGGRGRVARSERGDEQAAQGVRSSLYTKMVNAGEIGGVLDVILQRLSASSWRRANGSSGRSRVRWSTRSWSMLIAIGYLVRVSWCSSSRSFEEIFADFEVELPALDGVADRDEPTGSPGNRPGQRAVAGRDIHRGAVIPAICHLRTSSSARHLPGAWSLTTDWILLKSPMLWFALIKKSVIARFTRTLGTLDRRRRAHPRGGDDHRADFRATTCLRAGAAEGA